MRVEVRRWWCGTTNVDISENADLTEGRHAPRAHALEKPDLLKEPGGGAGPMNGEGLFRGAVFGVRARVRVLAVTAPGLLPPLATSCGEAKVTAFNPRTREYKGSGVGCWLRAEVCVLR